MSAEDYHDVPGIGGDFGSYAPRAYTCNFCKASITFRQRKAYNKDGTRHLCKTQSAAQEIETPQEAVVFALAAMNAIVNASIQVGGVDYIHHMNFYDVADSSWRIASAMCKSEKNFREEFGDFK